MKLRQYQVDAINSIYKVIREGKNPLCYISTGGGKTFIFSRIVLDAKSKNRKILIIVNKLILIENTIKEFKKLGITSSIYCGRDKTISDITIATIQSLYKLKENEFNVVIFDEGHRFDIEENESLKRLLLTFKNTIFLTFTATPWRNGEYIFGDDKFWALAYEKNLRSLTDEKFLVPIAYQNQNKESFIDVSNVKKDSEDYVLSALQNEIMNHKDKIKLQIDDALSKSKDRKKIVVITTGIDHCRIVHEMVGEESSIIHSGLSDLDREKNLDDFNTGKTRILVSVLIVSEGYDNPLIDCIWFFRPTRSPTLYIQAAGRGLRISEGKKDCLFLDYGNVCNELGSIYDVKLKKDKKERSHFKVECPLCDKIYFSRLNNCDCGHLFIRDCLFCGFKIPLADKCSCEDRIDSKVKNLTIDAYSDVIKIINPTFEMCAHQGPKQLVTLAKIGERNKPFAKKHFWFLPDFLMDRVTQKLEIEKVFDYKKQAELFEEEIKFVILNKDGKYFKPVALGLENSTYILN